MLRIRISRNCWPAVGGGPGELDESKLRGQLCHCQEVFLKSPLHRCSLDLGRFLSPPWDSKRN